MRIISMLGLVASIAMAVTAQITAINPRLGAWVMLGGAVAAATGGALSKYLGNGTVPAALGVIVAAAGVLAGATDLLPTGWAAIIAVIGTAAAAAGKSLFGWEDAGSAGSSGATGRDWSARMVLIPAFLVGALPLMAATCSRTPDEAQRTIVAGVYDAQLAIEAGGRTSLAFNTRGRLSLPKHKTASLKLKGVSTAFNRFGAEIEQWPVIEAGNKQQAIDAATRLLTSIQATVEDGELVAIDGETQSQIRRAIFVAITIANGIKIAIASAPVGTPTAKILIAEATAREVANRQAKGFTDQDALLTQDLITIWTDFLVKVKQQRGQPLGALKELGLKAFEANQAFFAAQLAR